MGGVSSASAAGTMAARGPRRFVMKEVATPMGEHPRSPQPGHLRQLHPDRGPFYHGTKSVLATGAELIPGHGSSFHDGRLSNKVYFTTLLETAAWGAELATTMARSGEWGRIYRVEPIGRSR